MIPNPPPLKGMLSVRPMHVPAPSCFLPSQLGKGRGWLCRFSRVWRCSSGLGLFPRLYLPACAPLPFLFARPTWQRPLPPPVVGMLLGVPAMLSVRRLPNVLPMSCIQRGSKTTKREATTHRICCFRCTGGIEGTAYALLRYVGTS
jgi:hypothetical protein